MRPDNLDAVFALFESRTNLEKIPSPARPSRAYRLDRMRLLCQAFDNPQDAVPSVHLAGSKGKGSTGACVAALLSAQGFRTGIYSSPHLLDYRERIRIFGEPFPERPALELAWLLLDRLPEAEAELPGKEKATTFELLTLFAFLLFRECGCTRMVIETGLGGRLDATNVIKAPLAAVITPIEKEHTEILGKRLVSIAAEKAGIFKKQVPVWSASQLPPVRRTLNRQARRAGTSIRFPRHYLRKIVGQPPEGRTAPNLFSWEIHWKKAPQDPLHLAVGNETTALSALKKSLPEPLHLAMGGRIQAENAVLALNLVRSMHPEADSAALSSVRLPGRFQFLRCNPPILIDGAHTPRSVEGLAEAFAPFAGENPLLIFGSTLGKNHQGMARVLAGRRTSLFRDVIISTPGFFKPSNPPEVAESFRRYSPRVRLIPDPLQAFRAALQEAGNTRAILVCGSFFMAGAVAALPEARRLPAASQA